MTGPGANVILVGSMGAGKTTVGRRLAEALGLAFVDTDALVERTAGASVADIFTRWGERRFRAIERRVIARAIAGSRQVIATGGGALMDPRNRARLLGGGLTIWLAARPDVMVARLLAAADRPLLTDRDRSETIAALLREREPFYRQALIHLETSDLAPEQAVTNLLRRLRPPAATVAVSSSQGDYAVEIGWDTLSAIGPRLAALGRAGRVGIVTNPRVGALYGKRVLSSVRAAGFRPFLITVPDGERYKTLRTLGRIYDELVRRRFERGDTLLALGGGVIGDLAGFAAATYLRGVAYVHVPTTVVAQVDSSIGGKTGVDHPAGKNLIGAFHQPILVYTDVSTLATLPRRELIAGLAEVVKYGVVADDAFFSYVEAHAESILGRVPDVLAEVVRRSVELKAGVVERDEKEAGLRRVLNYGHTIGHVVETCTGYGAWRHGEAVAVGMDFAARLAHRMGLCSAELVRRQRALLERLGLPWMPPAIAPAKVTRTMALDKKVTRGRVHFVLPEDLGRVRVEPVEADAVAALWREGGRVARGRRP